MDGKALRRMKKLCSQYSAFSFSPTIARQQALMDELNRSCRLKSRRDKGKFSVPVYALARTAFKRVIQSEGAKSGCVSTVTSEVAGLAVRT
jgi:hypothetical protein